ncbi:MAG: peptidylprolyl isomerase [Candidatus Omnitrophica bacterium]|nr:peptidylprolyl isomerase [Candidatus Omnitrophota bacterium]
MLRADIRRFIVIVLCCGVAVFSGSAAKAAVLDKVIVVVNDEVVTQREFDRVFMPIKRNFEMNFNGKELETRMEEARKAILEQIINTKIAISLAKKQSLKVDKTELDKSVEKIKAYYPSNEEFLKALSDRGTNYTEFKKEIEDQMLAQQLIDKEVAGKIVIAPAEIKDIYEKNTAKFVAPKKYKISGIMIRKGETPEKEQAADEKIRKIHDLLKGGADFAETAKTMSDGPYAPKGGDMGYVVKGQLLEEMEGPIFATAKGQMTDVIKTEIGYHIFKVDDIEESRQLKLEEVSDFIKNQIFKSQFDKNLSTWLEEKRKNAFISYK